MASLKKTTQISKSTQKINKEHTLKTTMLVQPRSGPSQTEALRSSSKEATLKKSHSFMRSTACQKSVD
jgi:hypothetical protein